MKTKRNVTDGLLIALVLITIFFVSIRIYNDRNITSSNHFDEVVKHENTIKDLIDRINIQSDYSCFNQLSDSLVLTNITGEKELLKNIIKNYTIVLYIDSHYCQSCVYDCITELCNMRTNKLKDLDLVILAGNYSIRSLKAFCVSKKIDIPSYMIEIKNYKFFKKMQTSGNSFYFLLSPNLEVSNILFPSDATRSLINMRYFETLNKASQIKLDSNTSNNRTMVINPKIDLGNIKLKNKYSTEFFILNRGEDPCIFESINSSCNCVIPYANLTPLLPDSTRRIKVDIYPQVPGEFMKKITLKTKSLRQPFIHMMVSGVVE